MKQKIIFLGLLVLCGAAHAQRVKKGEAQINAGIGFSNGWGMPVYAGFDYGVHHDITVGLEGSYSTEKYSGDIKGSWFGIGINGNYHFNSLLKIPDKFDVYAGVTLTYNSFSYKFEGSDYDYYGGDSSGVGFAGQAGARYYFTDHFAVNVEFGGGTVASGAKAGISYKF